MNNPIVYQQKRDRFGKFKSIQFKKLAWSLIKKQLFILGWLLTILLAHQTYVITCAAGGHLMTRQACGDETSAKFDATQLAQTQNQLSQLQNNSDLYR